MADLQPFLALRYAPNVDLAAAVCPPFDVISPEEQRALHRRSPHNAVHIELPLADGDPYQRAADTLRRWLDEGALQRDPSPAFYLYRQTFEHGGRTYSRLSLFARLRLEEWEKGIVLPHEQTFPAPKEDRLRLLRALRVNTSPVFFLYGDGGRSIAPQLDATQAKPPLAGFSDPAGQGHALWRIDEPAALTAVSQAFAGERLYVADGHHRYETALAYRDERRAAAPHWTGDEPENFALAALTAADDTGLLVLPIHRLVNGGAPLEEAFRRLMRLFDVETFPAADALLAALAARGRLLPAFGLVAADSPDCYLLTVSDPEPVDSLLPQDRSPAWRRLDASITTHAILRHGLGLDEKQVADINVVWYSEDAVEAVTSVRGGRCHYAVLLNPVPPRKIIALADAGERMPQKSTFFYPKLPTGLLFNPLDE